MGELRKRGNVWWMRWYREGRRYEESARTSDYDEARRELKLREGAVAGGSAVTPQVGRLRFEDAAKDIETDYLVNGRKSLEELQRRIRLHLTPAFGRRRMASITTADVRAFTRKRIDAGAAPGEINRELSALRRMFTLAVKGGRLLSRPHIPMLREHNVRTGFFERDAFEAVRAGLPAPLRAVVTFAYLTGWRIRSEVLILQWRQVDLKARTVRLDPGATKNQEGRLFPFAGLSELGDVLDAQRAVTTAVEGRRKAIVPWVFHREGKPIKSFYGAWRLACEAAGAPGAIPHDLRRTAVRNLERAGVSRSVAMQLTGHKTEAVYRRYAIVSEEDLGVGVAKLEALAGTISGTIGRKGRVRRFRRSS